MFPTDKEPMGTKIRRLISTITPTLVREWLLYNPKNGIFTWKKSPKWGVLVGDRAGQITKRGCRVISLLRVPMIKEHRLAWLYLYGVWPTKFIDHINGDPSDNRICNLREATPLENSQNLRRHREHTPNIFFRKDRQKWISYYNYNNKRTYLGLFTTRQEAEEAYFRARSSYGK